MKAYKGFNKDMTCRAFQYKEGGEYETDRAEVCESGFHACENPLDVLRFYPLRDGNRYCEVEQSGETRSDNCKTASTKIKIGAEIGLPGLIKAYFAYTRSKAESGQAGGYGSNLAGGDRSLCVVRNGKAKGGKNSVLVLTSWNWRNDEYVCTCVRAIIIDGKEYKPDTWYALRDGEVVEVAE